MSKLLESLKQLEEVKVEQEEDEFVTTNLSELVAEAYQEQGLRWRLPSLNRSLGSLRKGDFGFVFARPETGKTTFLASEISYMLQQTEEGNILWFNNEEQGKKVMLRIYQAFFGVTFAQLLGSVKKYEALFKEATKGRLLFVDKAGLSKVAVERIIAKHNPILVLFDQIDKIQGFKADRDDLLLGSIYIWARELAKKYCPVIGVCQADGTGENTRWLTMGHVANAKTAKQAEADFIIGIGKIHDSGWEHVRFLNLSKNKLIGDADTDPSMRHGKMEVLIDPEYARYKEIGG